MYKRSSNATVAVRAVVAALFVLVTLIFVSSSDYLQEVSSQTRRRAPARAAAPPRTYSSFPHDVKAHRMECGSCHKFPSENWNKVRTGSAAFPDITEYPKHESCLDCHRQQFFRGRPPVICSICHTNPGPRDSSRHPFLNPREIFDTSAKAKTAAPSDFAINFPHDKHIDIVTAIRSSRPWFREISYTDQPRAEESCVVCHTTLNPQGTSNDEFVTKPPANIGDAFWLKKGTFKSTPTGHTTCFTCHSQDSGIVPTPTDCATCHKIREASPPADFDPKRAATMGVTDRVTLEAWRTRHSSGTFRHEFQTHSEMSCDTCHNVQTMNTLDVKTKRVAVSACATCHVTATVDDGGAMNFEVQSRKSNSSFECTKCHVVFGKLPIPQSHNQSIIDAGGKP